MLKNYALFILHGLVFTFSACKEDTTVPKSSAKAITKLTFPQFNPVVQATIDETTKRITAVVPPTADVTKLIPSISVSLKAKVLPDSGKVQDFTNDVTYSVTAEDGTKADYKVMVSRTKFSGKDILTFTFPDFSPAIVAKIDPATKTITATVPATADLTKLKPTITLSDRATINPASATIVDFSKPVNFTVTAEDAGTQVYAVTVVSPNSPISIKSGKNPSRSMIFVSSRDKSNLEAIDALTGKLVWSFYNNENAKYYNPTVYDGNIILKSNGVKFIDASTGTLNGIISNDNYSGLCPMISNDIMYYGSGKDKYLRAFDLKAKKQKWATETDYSIDSNPTLYKGILFTSRIDVESIVTYPSYFYAYDAETGILKWKADVDYLGGVSGSASPCTFENLVISAGSSVVQAFDIYTGERKWIFGNNYGGGFGSDSSPTESEGIIYYGAYNKNLYAINAVDGTLKWKFETDGRIDTSPIVDQGVVFIYSNDSYVYAIDKKTGLQKWKTAISKNASYTYAFLDSSPIVVEDVLYIIGLDGTLYALNAKNGTELWKYENSRNLNFSSPCVIDKNGKVYHSGMSGMTN
jgi:eukaryotic-like serine/threonine-protein kinase